MSAGRSTLAILLALAVIRGVMYAALVPPWQSPDEPAQFERARAALSGQEWDATSENGPPWYDDLAVSLFKFDFWDFIPEERRTYIPDAPLSRYIVLYQELYNGLYSSRTPYVAMAGPLFLANSLDITLQLYLVRFNMILMSVGIIFFAYLTTRTIFPNDIFLVLGVPILILFIPQHTYLLSTVNNGNLAEFLTVVALYFLVKGMVNGFSWPTGVAAACFSLAAMWTKATAFFLPFAIGTVGLFYLWPYRRRWRWLLPLGVILLGLVYFFSPERLRLLVIAAWINWNAGNFNIDSLVPQVLFRSFWVMPGWLTLQLNPFWYNVLAVACIVALLGLILALVANRRRLLSRQFQPQLRALTVLAVAAVVSIAVLLSWNAISGIIIYRQGRSIYPVIVPISIFLMLGWRQLIPAQWRNPGLLTITAVLFLFDTMVLFTYILPFFYSRY